MNKVKFSYRSFILILSVLAMVFAGLIYAWSILKVPFAEDFGWSAEQLSLNYTLTMCCFCSGGLLGSFLARKIKVRWVCMLSAILSGSGMALAGLINGNHVALLYLSYALLAGLGIGIAYNVIISTVSAWYPDKKGFCSGCLMMGFGASALILGNLADALFKTALARRGTYLILGLCLLLVLGLVALFLKRPEEGQALPAPNSKKNTPTEEFEPKDYTTKEMLARFTFWRGFVLLIFAAAIGNSVISFARDLAVSIGATASLATSLVGILAVCNGLGRIITGAMFDALGRKKTMFLASSFTILASAVSLLSVIFSSVALCIVGLCMVGFSYGACPTTMATFVSSFYGQKNFASNFSIMNCHLFIASFVATACSSLLNTFGNYIVPFGLLLTLAILAWLLNLSLKRP